MLKDRYKKFAISLAMRAGKMMRRNFVLGGKRTWKKDHSPLTKTDLVINQMVIDAVHKHFPGYGVLAEEGSSLVQGSEYVWVCDPIDGTVPFSHGFPTFVFSLALVKNGQPIFGLLYDPMMNRMYVAEKGKPSKAGRVKA